MDLNIETIEAYKEAAREQAGLEFLEEEFGFDPQNFHIRQIDQDAVGAYEEWRCLDYDFGWDRVPRWKKKDKKAMDIALWYIGHSLWALLCKPQGQSRQSYSPLSPAQPRQ